MVFTLETIVEKFGEEMAPFAVGLCEHITQAFWRLQVCPSALLARPNFFAHFSKSAPLQHQPTSSGEP